MVFPTHKCVLHYGGWRPGKPVLRGLDFAIEPGVKVGLVGETGSGKTTCSNLLPRLYPIDRGTIEIDGVPVQDWQRTALRKQFGFVSQDVVIFSGMVILLLRHTSC